MTDDDRHDDFATAANALQDAVEDWKNAVDLVATALSDLEEFEAAELRPHVRRSLSFQCDGFNAWRKRAAALEPDQGPPVELADLAAMLEEAIHGEPS